MVDTALDMDAYLERIGYSGGLRPCEKTLRKLHRAHTLGIPFENLDVYYRRPVSLETSALFKKIVTRARGGYCFEMNGLFAAVLKELGFKVRLLLARVGMDFKRKFGPKTHQVLMVEASNKRWLADVGFGKDGLVEPIRLDTRDDQQQFSRVFRLDQDPGFGYVLDLVTPNTIRCQYAFTLEACTMADYLMSNYFTATHPDSLFVRHRICTIPTAQGRVTLTDTQLKIDSPAGIEVTPILNEADFGIKLRKYFGIDLDSVKNTVKKDLYRP